MGEEDYLWYFAIGSMMLPASYENREFYPKESMAAELLDYKINFFPPAEAVPSKGDSMHGVLHKVTPAQMKDLDKIEAGYVRENGKARTYDSDTLIDCTVYCRPKEKRENLTSMDPEERYIKLLAAGARHYNLKPEYISFLENHSFRPRKSPEEFKTYGDGEVPSTKFTEVPVTEKDGPIFVSINGKVLEMNFPADSDDRTRFLRMIELNGPHLEFSLARMLYDTKYGVPASLDQFTREHSAYREDMSYCFMKMTGAIKHVKVLGEFEQTWVD